ncbi:type II toxin-antitoxin system RelE/ParE family toxin [Candidatus Uhrbacteria bacterium]|nr:type II toxin-antitoxin system RelE/ParE family toxin [Candidatus Uhrbacteria bacterium]
MAYTLFLLRKAEKQLLSLDPTMQKRIAEKLAWLGSLEDPSNVLKFLNNKRLGDARLRVGEFRLVLVLDGTSKKITVIRIGHRSDVYKF